jgi:hypothetical protein
MDHRRKPRFQQYFHYFTRIRCRGNVFTEPFPSNDCFYGSTILVLSKYAAIYNIFMYTNNIKNKQECIKYYF